MCFWLSTTLPETFLILRMTERDIVISLYTFQRKVCVILVRY